MEQRRNIIKNSRRYIFLAAGIAALLNIFVVVKRDEIIGEVHDSHLELSFVASASDAHFMIVAFEEVLSVRPLLFSVVEGETYYHAHRVVWTKVDVLAQTLFVVAVPAYSLFGLCPVAALI